MNVIRTLVRGGLSALVLSACTAASAQESGSGLQGTVRDVSGAVVTGAVVTARNLGTLSSIRTVSDSRGSYAFTRLEPGTYSVEAAAPGFRHDPVEIRLVDARTVTRDLTLEISSLAETIVVTRAAQDLSVVPQAVGVLLAADLRPGQRRISLAEGLTLLPGVFAQDRGNLSESNGLRLSVRAPVRGVGMGIRGLQILQDDIPLTMADGTTQVSNVDLASADRIEVIRGPAAVLYGNSAGGAITIRTEAPSSRPFVVEPDVQVGSYRYQRQQVKASGTAGRVGYLVSISRMETDGFRHHSRAETRQAHLLFQTSVSSRTDVRAVFDVADMPFSESPSTLTREDARANPRSVRQLAIDQGLGESSTQGQGGLTVEHRLGNGQVVRATGWGMWRDVWNPIPFRIINLGRGGAGLRVEYSGATVRAGVPVVWTSGLDVAYQRDDRVEHENDGVSTAGRAREGARLLDQRETVRSVAPFAQLSIAPGPRWIITAGFRFDAYTFRAGDRLLADGDQSGTRRMQAVSPTLGITFEARPGLHVYGTAARAYETPTAQELSNRPSGEGGFNPDLEPETLRSVEGGVRGHLDPWRLSYDVAAYASTLNNALVRFERADEQEFFRNAGTSSRDGLEALIGWTPKPPLTLRLAYTYQRFRFDRFVDDTGDFSGKWEPGAPPHQLLAGATYVAPFGLTASARVRWQDAYPVNNANTVFNWASRVIDLRFELDRTWSGVALHPFVGIENVFAERYNGSTVPNAVGNRFFEPSPGRVFYAGLRLEAGVR